VTLFHGRDPQNARQTAAEEVAEISLARAIAFVTRNPARAAGLHDRGEIAAGKRADLVAVQHIGNLPHPGQVWSRGRLALATGHVLQ
jgi:alpha-D-ribose 1-methylphosphonate 5-triphosphate diphosphatase